MKNILKLAIVLFLICGLVTLVLAFVNDVTAPVIEERTLKDQIAARQAVLPAADDFQKAEDFAASGSVLEVYRGLKDGVPAGYAINVAPDGYGGKIQAIVGIDLEGNVTGVKITELSETPGLGAKVNEAGWTDQYLMKGAKEFGVVKMQPQQDNEIQAVSGATISSRAVTQGVNDALKAAAELGKGAGE